MQPKCLTRCARGWGLLWLCSCWLSPAFLSLCLRHLWKLLQRLVSEHTIRHDPLRWRLDITTTLENQCGVFSTCCSCLGWNSLIFSSSDISCQSHWVAETEGKDGAYTKILQWSSSYRCLFALVLPPVVSYASEKLYIEIVPAAIEVLLLLKIKRKIAITLQHQQQKNIILGFGCCWEMVWGEAEGQGCLGEGKVSDLCLAQGQNSITQLQGDFSSLNCISRHGWAPPVPSLPRFGKAWALCAFAKLPDSALSNQLCQWSDEPKPCGCKEQLEHRRLMNKYKL